MDRDRAQSLLGVAAGATEADVRAAFAARTTAVRQRIAQAPSDALKAKFERQLADLQDACEALTLEAAPPASPGADLPLSASAASRIAAAPVGAGRTTADGRYDLLEVVVETAVARVHRTTEVDGRALLVGVPAASVQASAELRRRFLEQSRASQAHLSPEAGGILDLGGEDAPYFVVDVDGEPLAAEIERTQRRRRPVPVADCIPAAAELSGRLAAAAPGFVHGALDPQTLWRRPDGRLAVLGFGLAEAPSQANDVQEIARGLAVLLTGQTRPPSVAELVAKRPDLPRPAAMVIGQALSPAMGAAALDLAGFAKGLRGDVGPAWLPPAVARRVAGLSAMQMLGLSAAAAAAVAIGFSYPAWRQATPWEKAADKQEAIRLAGVVKVLAARAAEQRTGLKQQSEAAAREKDRLLEKLESTGDPREYDKAMPRYINASLESGRLARVQSAYETRAGARFDQATVTQAEADSLLAAGDSGGALSRFQRLQTDFTALSKLPADLRREAEEQDIAQAAKLGGAWGAGSCSAASQWKLRGDQLLVAWPGRGEFREKIVGVEDDVIYTSAVTPEDNAGRVFSYRLAGGELTAQDLGRRTTMRLGRC